jgi:hypothetical protein
MADLVDEGGFVGAEAAPSGPKFEEHDLAFDGFVGEFFTSGCGGVEAGGGLFVFGAGERAKSGKNQYAGDCSPQEDGSGRHGRDENKCGCRLSITLLVRSKNSWAVKFNIPPFREMLNTEFTESTEHAERKERAETISKYLRGAAQEPNG